MPKRPNKDKVTGVQSAPEGWVRMPPAGNYSKEELEELCLCIGEYDLPPEIRIHLPIHRDEFERHGEGLKAMEVFTHCIDNGIFPPASVLGFFSEIFKSYFSSNGVKGLDEMMGLTYGPGVPPALKNYFIMKRDEMLCLDVYRLRSLFKISILRACEMVIEKLEATPDWNKTKHAINEISPTTLDDIYRSWKKKSGLTCSLRNRPLDSEKMFSHWTPRQREDFLKTFPPTQIRNLKSK